MERHLTPGNGVCVIIAAMNSSTTIVRAIRSALREAEVHEVVVVDDGSSDDTAVVAATADDGTGRLKILSLPQNKGPSFARNHAIEQSTSPLLAILDADDFLLPGRFSRLFDADDWDFIADNIVFIDERDVREADPEIVEFAPEPRLLDLRQFVEGNISIRGKQRGEIGFLKPVMRRAFLDEHGLRYREELRLGEDYELYARALALGARYKIVHGCGYGAVVRGDSLSGRHRTVDLQRLYEADRSILELPNIPDGAADALHAHESSIRDRYELRAFLDVKAQSGLNAAAKYMLSNASAWPAIVKGIVADKFDAWSRRGKPAEAEPRALRYLLPGMPLTKDSRGESRRERL